MGKRVRCKYLTAPEVSIRDQVEIIDKETDESLMSVSLIADGQIRVLHRIDPTWVPVSKLSTIAEAFVVAEQLATVLVSLDDPTERREALVVFPIAFGQWKIGPLSDRNHPMEGIKESELRGLINRWGDYPDTDALLRFVKKQSVAVIELRIGAFDVTYESF